MGIMSVMRKLRWFFEKSMCYSLVFVITPYFFIFEMMVVRPVIVKTYSFSSVRHTFHVLFSLFLFININGNMILGIFTDTTIRTRGESKKTDGTYCDSCKVYRPAKSWHCRECNACILKRDHHCFFFSRCIGLRNQRFYVTYLTYIFISMIYSTYFNYYYVVTKLDDHDIFLSVLRFINPFLRYLIPEPLGMKDLYVVFLFLNMGLLIWSGGLFTFHMRNVLKGETSHEYKENRGGGTWMTNWSIMRKNFIGVYGIHWYLAVLWPLANSPLPDDKPEERRE